MRLLPILLLPLFAACSTEGPETEGPETESPETEGPQTEGPEIEELPGPDADAGDAPDPDAPPTDVADPGAPEWGGKYAVLGSEGLVSFLKENPSGDLVIRTFGATWGAPRAAGKPPVFGISEEGELRRWTAQPVEGTVGEYRVPGDQIEEVHLDGILDVMLDSEWEVGLHVH